MPQQTLGLIARLAEKPLDVILWKLRQRLQARLRRRSYWRRLTRDLEMSVRELATKELRVRLAQAPQLLPPHQVEEAAADLGRNDRQEVAAVVAAADEVLALRFQLLGETLVRDRLPLPWTSDWRRDHRWREGHHSTIDYSRPGRSSDVKYPWELSRFYFTLPLGQAAALTGDPRYRQHWLALVDDWQRANPIAYSVNWTSPLEVALRGVHLACGLSLFPDLEDHDLVRVVTLLASHGAFLARNLEYSDVRANHYAGNLYGLLVLGLLLEGVVPEATRWRQRAEGEIGREIELQLCADGVSFERSTHYHRLVTEMFLYSAILLERAGRPLAGAARTRIGRAVQFMAAYTRPDGIAPVIGDTDDGWALAIGQRPARDHRGLYAVAAVWLAGGDPVTLGADLPAEPLWLFGAAARRTWSELEAQASPTLTFPDGGFLVSRRGEHHLILDVGEVGLNRRGGHGHHDALSFELTLNGLPLVVDPGMPSYTGDVTARNRYRSTAWHNTARIDGSEQGSLDPRWLWRLGGEAEVYGVGEERRDGVDRFHAGHRGFERLARPVGYRRQLTLDGNRGTLAGEDRFVAAGEPAAGKPAAGEPAAGEHALELFFHLAAGLLATPCEGGVRIAASDRAWLFRAAPGSIAVEPGEVSPGYGVREPAEVVRVLHRGTLPVTLSWSLTPIAVEAP